MSNCMKNQEGGADDASSSSSSGITVGGAVFGIFQVIAWIGALFLAFKCRGMDPMHLLVACCCPYCYIPFGLFCLYGGGGGGRVSSY